MRERLDGLLDAPRSGAPRTIDEARVEAVVARTLESKPLCVLDRTKPMLPLAGPWTLERVYTLFPRLRERRSAQGTSLSGGEQQMLAIARALMTHPRYLLLDEPTEDLAPVIVEQIVAAIAEIRAAGMGIVLVEQNLHVPRQLADHYVLLDSGHITWTGGRDDVGDALEDMLSGLSGHSA